MKTDEKPTFLRYFLRVMLMWLAGAVVVTGMLLAPKETLACIAILVIAWAITHHTHRMIVHFLDHYDEDRRENPVLSELKWLWHRISDFFLMTYFVIILVLIFIFDRNALDDENWCGPMS
jgi:amino acid permease